MEMRKSEDNFKIPSGMDPTMGMVTYYPSIR